ncbi:MAG: flagellar basal body L-ring protein FlgH [Fimbriimonadaceae bacterium]
MRILTLVAALMLSASALAQDGSKANPGSLVNSGASSPLTDIVARRVGDLLTVIVDEKALAEFAAKTQASKSDSASFSPSFFVDFFQRIFRPFSVSSSSKTQGDGTTTNTQKMEARLTAKVIEVTPEGNLVIEGVRTLVTNKDSQTLYVRGTVRRFDVQPDNTVKSASLADAEVSTVGKGLVADRQKRGLITSLLEWLF